MSEQQPIAVVKYGSTSVANKYGLNTPNIKTYAEELAGLRDEHDLVVVTSGAVAAGKLVLKGKVPYASDQTYATAGSPALMREWQFALAKHGVPSGEVLVTHREIEDHEEGGMLLKTLKDNMRSGLVSVINENDALSDVELARRSYGGDNDGLAAHVAEVVGARYLCLMTDVDGLKDENDRVVREVNDQTAGWAREVATRSVNDPEKGGMVTKVEAALRVAEIGIDAYIGNAKHGPGLLMEREAGTYFPAHNS